MNKKIVTIIVTVLAVVGLILSFMAMIVDKDDAVAASGAASPLVTFSLILLGITAVVAVLGSLFSLLKNPAALKKALFGIVALVIVGIISYILANSDQVIDAKREILAATDSQVSKLTSTGIWFTGVLLLVSTGFFVWDLLKGLVKS